MISSNADEVQESLKLYAEQLGSKLEAMVAGFAGEVALKASLNTAVASEETLRRWQNVYKDRQADFGISAEPGYHAGAWKYIEGAVVFDDPSIRPRRDVQDDAMSSAKASFRLGDTFKIAAIGPNMQYLNRRDGIIAATEKAVAAAFVADVQKYFSKG